MTRSGNGPTTLSFYDEKKNRIVDITMDEANAYMLGSDLIDVQVRSNEEPKKENVTVSLCQ